MDLDRVLAELLRERDLIDKAIAHLERFSRGTQDVSSRPRGRAHADATKEKVRSASGAALD
jgi:hypothetical protein